MLHGAAGSNAIGRAQRRFCRTTFLSVGFLTGVFLVATGASPLLQAAEDSVVYTRSDLLSYLEKWKSRDGAAGTVISDYFCMFAAAEPQPFLGLMAEHQHVFREWIQELPNLSFVDFGGCIDRECLRTMMLRSLERVPAQAATDTLQTRLLEVLRRSSVRKVE